MRPTFHNSKAKLTLIRIECENAIGIPALKDVSDVKRDGNVIVKLRSTAERDLLAISMDLLDHLVAVGWDAGYDSERERVWVRIDSVLV
jgi:hypothetical protein